MSRLRGFQQAVQDKCYASWDSGKRVVMPVMSTGTGKTVLMSDTARRHDGYGVVCAHRHELVSQIAMALATEGVRHNIIGSAKTIRAIVTEQTREFGRSFYDIRAPWSVASVDTLIRASLDAGWKQRVSLLMQDEGHHVLRDNKWGRVFDMFPNAKGLLPTATPERADGRGLGSHADGWVDEMIIGPPMRYMIDNGFLTGYVIRAPRAEDLDLTDVEISNATGDYNQDQVRKKVKESNRLVGDVVRTYLRFAAGKRGITFAVDVEHATTIANAYNAAGVPAQIVSSNTPDGLRLEYMREFKAGNLLQLVNVDLFGEGVDVPACECVSMARPTASYGLYVQQFGRALRLMITALQSKMWDTFPVADRLALIASSAKPVAYIFDHVGNVIAHGGPPDMRTRPWSLDRRVKKQRALDGVPMRVCVNPECAQPYERELPACPYCGQEPPMPSVRTGPEHVDGDIVLYTPEMLQQLFGAISAIDAEPVAYGNTIVANSIRKNHGERKEAQRLLRETMQLVLPPTVPERVRHRRFYLNFGIDTLGAMTLGSAEAMALRQRILDKVTTT